MTQEEIYLVLGMGGLIAALLVVVLVMLVMEHRTRARRVLGATDRSRGRAGAHLKRSADNRAPTDTVVRMMRSATSGLTILKDKQIKETRLLLVSGGFRSRDAIVIFTFFKLVAPLAFLLGTAIVIYGLNPIGRGPWLDVAAVLGAALLGGRAPDLYVRNIRTRRLDTIKKSFPDALDMLVICSEAGLSSDAALRRLVAETGRTDSLLSQELDITVQELGFLPDRRQALENFAARVPLPAVGAFVNTMIQAERFGTPLSRAFKVLSQELRTERMMRAEEKAGRLPATMTIPMMLFILPALFIVLIGPAILDIMDKFIGM